MNIAAVEEKTGLARANIRYYEREGLLQPERAENGYRNYTEDNVETLLKIKLLRKLQVSLEEIRAIQAGTVSLEAVLERQAQRLGAQIQQLERARGVCRAICADGTDYGHMDAVKYLALLERGCEPEPWQKWDRIDETPHPWRRFFARSLDGALYNMIVAAVWFALLHHFPTGNGGETLLLLVVPTILMLILEPLWLHLWGTTPGKWLMGISIHTWDGRRLSWSQGLDRTWFCMLWGSGLCIPLFSLHRLYRSYCQCTDGQVSWDEDLQITCKNPGHWRTAGLVCAFPLLFSLALPIARVATLPPNRGDLTVKEFAENYNYYNQALTGSNWYLDAQGYWKQDTQGGTHLSWRNIVARPNFEYTVENGVLTGISYEVSGTDQGIMDFEQPLHLAVMAFVGAQKELPVLTGDFVRLTENLDQIYQQSFEKTWYGVDVHWTLELEGLYVLQNYLLSEKDDTDGAYRIALEMKLT